MQAIVTKYLGATFHNVPRVVAVTESGARLALPWDYSIDCEVQHLHTALALAKLLGWPHEPEDWVYGAIHGEYAYAFVLVPRKG